MKAIEGAAEVDRSVVAWAHSGAMALTGQADGPALGPPIPLVPRLQRVAAALARRAAELGSGLTLDPLQLLGERAALAGFARHGTTSCGGATRLVQCVDGWIAVTLARPDDVDLVPAWLGLDARADEPWSAVTANVAGRTRAELEDQAVLLGLPVASLPVTPPTVAVADAPLAPFPCRSLLVESSDAVSSLDGIVVVDLSALWAGPLAGAMLADAGATVIKVESTRRPDGARRGPALFFDLLNAGKRSVALDLTTATGRASLRQLVQHADVVIEASRPRALEQLGVDARASLRDACPRVWLSITAHGRDSAAGMRVGFGDDAAVAGGLVVWEGDEPRFCADAVADPASGLVAAAVCLDALAVGGSWLLGVALSNVAAHLAGPTAPVPADAKSEARPPRARASRGSARPLGADTADVLERPGGAS